MNDISAQFGHRFKAVRKQRKMTLDDMARLLGTSKQVLSRYENGQRTPKITTAQEFAERLGVPLGYFLGETDLPYVVKDGDDCVMSIIGRGGDQQIYHLTPDEADKLLRLLEVIKPDLQARPS